LRDLTRGEKKEKRKKKKEKRKKEKKKKKKEKRKKPFGSELSPSANLNSRLFQSSAMTPIC